MNGLWGYCPECRREEPVGDDGLLVQHTVGPEDCDCLGVGQVPGVQPEGDPGPFLNSKLAGEPFIEAPERQIPKPRPVPEGRVACNEFNDPYALIAARRDAELLKEYRESGKFSKPKGGGRA